MQFQNYVQSVTLTSKTVPEIKTLHIAYQTDRQASQYFELKKEEEKNKNPDIARQF